MSIAPRLGHGVQKSTNRTIKTSDTSSLFFISRQASHCTYTNSSTKSPIDRRLSTSWGRVEAGTHQVGGSCYAQSGSVREAEPRVCPHRQRPAEQAGIYYSSTETDIPLGVAGSLRRGGFRSRRWLRARLFHRRRRWRAEAAGEVAVQRRRWWAGRR